jgi:predicted nuclease with TOPRIM domain|tara:strand:- start:730 stop:942 length:213 start_codon:yes stop_codon:yes gene_type:complete
MVETYVRSIKKNMMMANKALEEYKVMYAVARETIKRLTKENETIKDEMKTLQGQYQNSLIRIKELRDDKS